MSEAQNRGEEAAKVGENNRGIKLETMGWARWKYWLAWRGGAGEERPRGRQRGRERAGVIIFTSGRSRKQRTRRLLDSFENSPKNRSFFFLFSFFFFFPSLLTVFLERNRSRF